MLTPVVSSDLALGSLMRHSGHSRFQSSAKVVHTRLVLWPSLHSERLHSLAPALKVPPSPSRPGMLDALSVARQRTRMPVHAKLYPGTPGK